MARELEPWLRGTGRDTLLRVGGHEVRTPTLPGVGERHTLAALDTGHDAVVTRPEQTAALIAREPTAG